MPGDDPTGSPLVHLMEARIDALEAALESVQSGASLLIANNLSDIADAPTALANLGGAASATSVPVISLSSYLPAGFVDGDDVDTQFRAFLTAVGSGRGYIGPGTYVVHLDTVAPANCDIYFAAGAIVRLKPFDLTAFGATGGGVINVSNGSYLHGPGCIDGNRDNMTGTPNATIPGPEGIAAGSGTVAAPADYRIDGLEIKNAVGNGVDRHGSVRGIVKNCHIHHCGGFGVHNSIGGTKRNRTANNTIHDCGATYSRGGIDQFTSTTNADTAHHNSVVGNVCYDNYRNFNIRGWNCEFAGNVSGGTTTGRDILTGVVKERLRNPTLGMDSNNDNIPDGWTAGAGLTAQTYLADGWQGTCTGSGYLLTQQFVPPEGDLFDVTGMTFLVNCWAKRVSGAGTAQLLIVFQTAASATISSVSAGITSASWSEIALTNIATAPATCQKVEIRLFATAAGDYAFRDVSCRG